MDVGVARTASIDPVHERPTGPAIGRTVDCVVGTREVGVVRSSRVPKVQHARGPTPQAATSETIDSKLVPTMIRSLADGPPSTTNFPRFRHRHSCAVYILCATDVYMKCLIIFITKFYFRKYEIWRGVSAQGTLASIRYSHIRPYMNVLHVI